MPDRSQKADQVRDDPPTSKDEGAPIRAKIEEWLKDTKTPDGRLKAGDWMAAILPHLTLHSASSSPPHPRTTFLFTVQPEHCNRVDALHGGCAATLFDFCTTMPLTMVGRPGFWQRLGVSRTLSVTYLRPAPRGEQVLVECEALQVGKRLASLRGTLRRASDGLLLATCEHTKANIDPPANGKL